MSDAARILITGYSGFVGGYLVAECRTRYPEAQIFGLTLSLPSSAAASMLTAHPLVPLVADMVQPRQVREAIAQARPDLVFHLAAQASVTASWNDPAQTLAINAGGAVNIFEALRAERLAPRIVLVGSGEQYGLVRPDENPIHEDCLPRPANPYAVSKVAQDLYGYQYFVAYGLPIMRARPFNHFGPHQTAAFVIASFACQIARIESGQAKPILHVGNLDAQRDFLPVEDVVRAYIALAEAGHPGEAYNVGSGQARSIHQILTMLLALARVPIEVHTDPARIRPTDVPILVADTSRLRAHTGWTLSADAGAALGRTLDYWRLRAAEGSASP
jgi:GDP-4-dehydro-6-deoxy-D-mannose reductase